MDNPDILQLIIRNRTMKENNNNNTVNKMFYDITNKIYLEQSIMLKFFKRFIKRTVFPKKKKMRHNYYTLKNIYINRENRPILLF
tara:strand:- start:409 stop:663 length:255 start_codon:yes stop_codon:yes gene_type:complete